MRQHEGAHRRIEREAVRSVARAIHQHRRRSIDHVTGGDLFAAGLQDFIGRDFRIQPVGRAPQDGKRRAYADVHVDVGGAVERIEHHDVLGIGRPAVRQHGMVVFLRGHHGHAFAHAQRVYQHLVGIHVELLLHFALHVDVAGHAQNVRQAGAAHFGFDQLRGQRDAGYQPGELARRTRKPALFAQDVLLDGNDRFVNQLRRTLDGRGAWIGHEERPLGSKCQMESTDQAPPGPILLAP